MSEFFPQQVELIVDTLSKGLTYRSGEPEPIEEFSVYYDPGDPRESLVYGCDDSLRAAGRLFAAKIGELVLAEKDVIHSITSIERHLQDDFDDDLPNEVTMDDIEWIDFLVCVSANKDFISLSVEITTIGLAGIYDPIDDPVEKSIELKPHQFSDTNLFKGTSKKDFNAILPNLKSRGCRLEKRTILL